VSVVSILRLPVRAGAEEEFVRRFHALEILDHARRSGGLSRGRLLRSTAGGPRQFIVLADWTSRQDYQTWLDNPARAQLGEQLAPLLEDEVEAGELFEEVD